MASGEPAEIECKAHGRRLPSVVCRHMLESPNPVGFVENSGDPSDLQAWCAACERMFLQEGDKTEAFRRFNGMAIVCDYCYHQLQLRHRVD